MGLKSHGQFSVLRRPQEPFCDLNRFKVCVDQPQIPRWKMSSFQKTRSYQIVARTTENSKRDAESCTRAEVLISHTRALAQHTALNATQKSVNQSIHIISTRDSLFRFLLLLLSSDFFLLLYFLSKHDVISRHRENTWINSQEVCEKYCYGYMSNAISGVSGIYKLRRK